MKDILQLVLSGKLGKAAVRILASLRRDRAAPAPEEKGVEAANDSAIDGVATAVDKARPQLVERENVKGAAKPIAAVPADGGTRVNEASPAAPTTQHRARRRTGNVQTLSFASPIGAMSYRLYVPDALPGEAPPLLLMLHGCTQNPDDFARGTRMDALAGAKGYLVVYPAQTKSRNLNKCWNWFDPSNHALVVGEAAALAALTEAVAAAHGVDPRRIFVAGLSAGGAMAVNLGVLYPQLFAAVGVHSGLPFGSARDIPSAFVAMQRGGASRAGEQDSKSVVPTIAFYGDADRTVNPANGRAIVNAVRLAAGDVAANGITDAATDREEVGVVESAIRSVYYRKDGRILAEEWRIPDGGHAWYGGDKRGSFTQPDATDASAHMLAFFSAVTSRPSANDPH
jgi:poly(hydroxyalkanoate) depolymerase family esterase